MENDFKNIFLQALTDNHPNKKNTNVSEVTGSSDHFPQ